MTSWRCQGPPAPSMGVLEASLPQNCTLFYFCCHLNRRVKCKMLLFCNINISGRGR